MISFVDTHTEYSSYENETKTLVWQIWLKRQFLIGMTNIHSWLIDE